MSIEINNESEATVDERAITSVARYVLDTLGINPMAELSILVVDSEAMATLHKQWMARSYAFSFIFVASRVTDAWPGLIDYSDERAAATALWSLVVLALIVPDLLMSGSEFFKNRRPGRKA